MITTTYKRDNYYLWEESKGVGMGQKDTFNGIDNAFVQMLDSDSRDIQNAYQTVEHDPK